ncbi:MAG: hypothetical protein DMG51_19915 [Acidobacteria bacterium]|nr:MAG: hypothetical protein DMG51_19915 [Acidobacteriota bacterium]
MAMILFLQVEILTRAQLAVLVNRFGGVEPRRIPAERAGSEASPWHSLATAILQLIEPLDRFGNLHARMV